MLLDLNLPDTHGSDVLKLLFENEHTINILFVGINVDAFSQQL